MTMCIYYFRFSPTLLSYIIYEDGGMRFYFYCHIPKLLLSPSLTHQLTSTLNIAQSNRLILLTVQKSKQTNKKHSIHSFHMQISKLEAIHKFKLHIVLCTNVCLNTAYWNLNGNAERTSTKNLGLHWPRHKPKFQLMYY